MSRKILFFINPISGTASKLQLEKKIITKCTERNIAFEILFTSEDGNYAFLKKKIEKESITEVVICGGDGSISHKNKYWYSATWLRKWIGHCCRNSEVIK